MWHVTSPAPPSVSSSALPLVAPARRRNARRFTSPFGTERLDVSKRGKQEVSETMLAQTRQAARTSRYVLYLADVLR